MEKRVLGRTGEKIPVVGMGTWRMGDTRAETRSKEIEALRTGIELGMTLVDTAESYGDGKAELLVGEAIRGMRDEIFFATKVSPHNFGYDDVLRACEASIQRLRIRFIDLYQLHWPNPRIPIEETVKAMEELVSRGRIKYIGVSNFSVEELIRAREALPRSEIVSNQVRYSLTARGAEADVLPFCERERVTLIAYSPLDMGRIPSDRIPQELLQKYGLTAGQAVLNWVTHKKAVVAIPKAAKVEHVKENASATTVRLAPEDYAALARAFS